jgi:hypothetical protein
VLTRSGERRDDPLGQRRVTAGTQREQQPVIKGLRRHG